jgi:DNA (cytosine-5)-methyltransferase 1
MIKVGSDFSGVGAFDQALKRLEIDYETIFACDMDKHARKTFIENYAKPKYYPENVYDREIPKESVDIYMTSPPCQAFSIAGKRKGETEERGVLFYNSHEFILKNKPRYFIFENVKGLLSDDNGRTFQRWIDYLSKSVNGQPVIFPHEESANYHVYYQVLNSKDYGVPQNRERIFIIGIRDDADNNFTFPPKEHLTKRLKDILEDDVDEKYFLSNANVNKILIGEDSDSIQCVGNLHPSGNGMNGNVYDEKGISPTLSTNKGEGIKIKQLNESQNPKILDDYNNKIREDGLCGTITQHCSRSARKNGMKVIWIADYRTDEGLRIRKDENSPCLCSSMKEPNENMSRGNCVPFVGNDYKIRRLTPRECFRLQDFPDSFKMPCSDSQMYKQAGNSITVGVLEKIIKRLIKI